MEATHTHRHSREERLQLINDCRRSGLSDAEWCRQHDICISTFYNWITKLRKEAVEIPRPSYGHALTESPKQEVVRVDVLPDHPEPAALPAQDYAAGGDIDNSHTIEIAIGDITIRAGNGASPTLLAQLVCALRGGSVC